MLSYFNSICSFNLMLFEFSITIFFELGVTHNAVEVSEVNYNANNSTPIENGFELGFGESNYIVLVESKTHYYVCTPHLPSMKAKIIVH